MTRSRTLLLRPAAAVLVLAAGLGCSIHRANALFEKGDYEGAHEAYRQVLQDNPGNVKARIGIQRTAELASQAHVGKARAIEAHGGSEEDIKAELGKALVFNLDNQIAQDWLLRIKDREDRAKAASQQESLEKMQQDTAQAGALQINPRSIEGVDLTFTRRTNLRDIFSTLAKASGVNILLHSSFQDASVSIDLKGLNFQKALDTLMLQSDLFYRVVDTNTIMVFKNTPQNREQYENQIIKTYYLSNSDPQDIRQSLTALMPQLRVFTDKRMNAVIVKARPLELAIATRVIDQLDKALPEVMVYVQLMEVTESNLAKVGLLPVIGPSDDSGVYRMGATTINTSGGLNTNTGNLNIPSSNIRFLFPNLALDFLKSNGDARLVANPNVRVVSGEIGKINIGEKVSTTQSSIGVPGAPGTSAPGAAGGITGLGGLGSIGQTSYNYEDVGVKIEVTPRVHFNDEVTLKIKASVTTLKAGSTPGRPDLGNRDIETVTRLKDGETAIFGGLLKDEEQKQLQGVWGLTDIPVIGRLFGNTNTNKAKTDVIMTLRCVLVRKPSITQQDLDAFNPDDAAVKNGPFAPKAAPKAAPGAVGTTTAAPAQPPATQAPAPAAAPAPAPDPNAPNAPAAAQRPPDASDLVFFISPSTANLLKGDKIEATLSVSGGQGLSSGYLDLQLPAGLKLETVTPGDFLAGGKIQQAPGPNGTVRLSFSRADTGTDSGTLASVTLQTLEQGNQPLLIQGGQFLAGANPISARWVNALFTVQ